MVNEKVASKFAARKAPRSSPATASVSRGGIFDYAFGSRVSYAATQTTPGIPAAGALSYYVRAARVASFGTGANGANELIDLVHRIPSAYHPGAAFMMHRRRWRRQEAQGRRRPVRLAERDGRGPAAATVGLPRLRGVGRSDDRGGLVPSCSATSALAIRSLIVRACGFSAIPFTSKPFVLFYSTKRVRGDVKNFQAISAFKFSAT